MNAGRPNIVFIVTDDQGPWAYGAAGDPDQYHPTRHGYTEFSGFRVGADISADPVVFPDPEYPNLDKPRLTRMTREYLAAVTGVDRNIGRLLDVLEHEQVADPQVPG
jgi:arylsulfatase A-like enzyme